MVVTFGSFSQLTSSSSESLFHRSSVDETSRLSLDSSCRLLFLTGNWIRHTSSTIGIFLTKVPRPPVFGLVCSNVSTSHYDLCRSYYHKSSLKLSSLRIFTTLSTSYYTRVSLVKVSTLFTIVRKYDNRHLSLFTSNVLSAFWKVSWLDFIRLFFRSRLRPSLGGNHVSVGVSGSSVPYTSWKLILLFQQLISIIVT